jgi:hypothetical protein
MNGVMKMMKSVSVLGLGSLMFGEPLGMVAPVAAQSKHVVWLRFTEEADLNACIRDGQGAVMKHIAVKYNNKHKIADFTRLMQKVNVAGKHGPRETGIGAFPYLHKKAHSTVGKVQGGEYLKNPGAVQKAVDHAVSKLKHQHVSRKVTTVPGGGSNNLSFTSPFWTKLSAELGKSKLFQSPAAHPHPHIGVFYGKRFADVARSAFDACMKAKNLWKKGLTVSSVDIYDVQNRSTEPEWNSGFWPENWYQKHSVVAK